MEKYTNEELLEVLPSSVKETKELTTKQKIVLGQLCVYNGLEIVKKNGYFYRSNKDLCDDCNIQEKTLIAAVRKLESLGFIERKKGARGTGASEYRINVKLIGDYCKNNTANYSNNYSEQIVEMSSRIKELEHTVKILMDKITVIESKNYSTETDKEIYNKNNNIINNNILEKNNILKENILKENEKLDSTKVEDNKNNFKNTSTIMKINKEKTESTQEVKRPSTYKELIEYFKEKMIQLTPNRTLDELNEIQESLKDELDEFSEINDFKNVYRYFILPSMEKKKDKLITKELGNSFNVEVVELEGAEKVF